VRAIRRSVVLSVVPSLCALSAFPQEGGTPLKEENLYPVALFASIAEMDKTWGHLDDSDGGIAIPTDYHRLKVEKDIDITDRLPSQLGDYPVMYLDNGGQIDACKKLRKEFSIVRIHPMQSNGTGLKIMISVYRLKYEKQRLLLALSDWSDVEFRYDCEKQKYVVSSVKLEVI
jgi:hypothetical protein